MIEDVLVSDTLVAEMDRRGSLTISQLQLGLQFNPDETYALAAWLMDLFGHPAGECIECGELVPINDGHVYHLDEGDALLCDPCHTQRAATVRELLNTVIE